LSDFWERLKRGEVAGLGVATALLAGVFGGLAPTLIKSAMPSSFNPLMGADWAIFFNPVFLTGAVLGVLSVIVSIVAFSYGKVSVLFPLSGGTGYTTTLISAYLMLGESFTVLKVVAVLIIFVGIVLLGRG